MKVVIFSLIFFILFSFNYDIGQFNATLFNNDFTLEGVSDWLAYEIVANILVISIGILGINYIQHKFIKRVFIAIIIDGLINIFRYIVFGYYEPFYVPALCNSIPFSYVLYSYFFYGRLD